MEKACKFCGKTEDIPPRRARCKACTHDYNQAYYRANRESVKAQVKRYREENLEKTKAASSKANKARWQRLRRQAFDAYGWRCACCGETEPQFLCIDHVNDDGWLKRKKETRVAFGTMGWLEKEGYPSGFQTLCHNCNFSKHSNGGKCIHQLTEGSETIPSGSTSKWVEAHGRPQSGLKI